MQRRDELDFLRLQFLVAFVDIIHGEGNPADPDVIQSRVWTALGRRVHELYQIEHGSVRVVAQSHEHTAQLLRLEPERITDPRVIHGEVVNLVESKLLIETD